MNKLKYYRNSEPFMLEIDQLFHRNLDIKEADSICECAVLTTYVCKERPLLNHIFKHKIPVTIFKEPRGKVNEPVQEFKHCRIIIPPNNLGFGCYHPKLMLLKFNDVLRVVVSSANLLEIDWLELGQVIWFQDFPKNINNESETNDFGSMLRSFLDSAFDDTHKEKLIELSKAQYSGFECPETIEDIGFSELIRGNLKLSEYNFNSAAVDLIPSVNGKIDIEKKDDYGVYRLASLLQKEGKFNIP